MVHKESLVIVEHQVVPAVAPFIHLVIVEDGLMVLVRAILDEVNTCPQSPESAGGVDHRVTGLTLLPSIGALAINDDDRLEWT